jgi:ribonuclease HI
MARARYYVVFAGREPGIYRDWARCQAQVDGFSGSEFRSFPTADEAERAWVEAGGDPIPLDEPGEAGDAGLVDDPDPLDLAGSPPLPSASAFTLSPTPARRVEGSGPPPGSIAVDAACSGNPGPMEYRGVDIDSGEQLFHVGPMHGTNNIGEFLAIVHGLAWLQRQGRPGPIYSDSNTAIGWVGRGTAKTTLARSAATESAWKLLARAQHWLREGAPRGVEIRKWPTRRWGEIPADFGRK